MSSRNEYLRSGRAAEATARALFAFGVHNAAVYRLDAGYTGTLWKVRTTTGDAILKRVHDRYSDEQVRVACRAQELVARELRASPPLFPTRTGEPFVKIDTGRYYMSPLVRGEPVRLTTSARTVEHVAELVARMHGALEVLSLGRAGDGFIALPVQPLESLELALARVRRSRAVDDELVRWLARKRDLLKLLMAQLSIRVECLRRQWIHGDVHPANLMWSKAAPRRLLILDFDQASVFPWVYEALGAFLKVVVLDRGSIDEISGLLERYVRTYARLRPEHADDLRSMVDFYLLVYVAETRTFTDHSDTLIGLREFARRRMHLTEWIHAFRSPLQRAVERALA